MSYGSVIIDQNRCKGCNLCVLFCPQHCLTLNTDSLNAKGYHPAQLTTDPGADTCTGCGVCAIICPDACITVLREPLPNRGERT